MTTFAAPTAPVLRTVTRHNVTVYRSCAFGPHADLCAHLIAGDLIALVAPIVQHYHSDIALDCAWIADRLRELRDTIRADIDSNGRRDADTVGPWSYSFHIAADGWGTIIGEDATLVHCHRRGLNLRIDVTVDNVRHDWTESTAAVSWVITRIGGES